MAHVTKYAILALVVIVVMAVVFRIDALQTAVTGSKLLAK
jgi:hypothetical protein